MEDSIRRLFTAEARTAALPANSGPADEPGDPTGGFGIFVIASNTMSPGYQWEVRKRDGSVLERSIETFRTMLLARYAGVRALAGD